MLVYACGSIEGLIFKGDIQVDLWIVKYTCTVQWNLIVTSPQGH